MNFIVFIWRFLLGQWLGNAAVSISAVLAGRVLAVEAGSAASIGASAAQAVQARRWLWPRADGDWLQIGLVSGIGARPPSGRRAVVASGGTLARTSFSQGRSLRRSG
jgi:hypothetical protein